MFTDLIITINHRFISKIFIQSNLYAQIIAYEKKQFLQALSSRYNIKSWLLTKYCHRWQVNYVIFKSK